MPDQKPRLWTRDFTLITFATTLGAAGWIAGEFALSFLVFDETGSTLASALVIAVELIPYVFVPLLIAPIMDRLPRKTFLVGGDLINGISYALMGLWLMRYEFSYETYLFVSILLSSLGSIDELAYSSIYPELIPEGAKQRGYAISGMLYPMLIVVMTPAAAYLLDTIGVPVLLIMQGALSVLAAFIESFIDDKSAERLRIQAEKEPKTSYTLAQWKKDFLEGFAYLKDERGIRSMYLYTATTNGVATGYSPLLVAFFRTTPGMSVAMYAMFSVFECVGRTIGGFVNYKTKIKAKHRFNLVFFVYQLYDISDMMLLWLPYPAMLANRAVCGFFGANSATLRVAATQSYIPEELRARVNAFEGVLYTAFAGVLSLVGGVLGEVLELRMAFLLISSLSVIACWVFIWGNRADIRKVYEYED